MKKLYILFTFIILTLAISATATGKKQLYKGYIITLNNDTIQGEIQYMNPALNELRVTFYKDGDKQKFSPKDITGYGFAVERYNKATKSKEAEWIHYERLNVEKSPIRQGVKEVFVQRQVSGSIKLYNFYTLKTRKINARSYEHAYYINNGSETTLVNRKNYRKVVRELVSNNEELYNKLGTAGYGYKYFANVVAAQNVFLDGTPQNVKPDAGWADTRETGANAGDE